LPDLADHVRALHTLAANDPDVRPLDAAVVVVIGELATLL